MPERRTELKLAIKLKSVQDTIYIPGHCGSYLRYTPPIGFADDGKVFGGLAM